MWCALVQPQTFNAIKYGKSIRTCVQEGEQAQSRGCKEHKFQVSGLERVENKSGKSVFERREAALDLDEDTKGC
jgi:hypothetical protein